jgi:hypothetical protein
MTFFWHLDYWIMDSNIGIGFCYNDLEFKSRMQATTTSWLNSNGKNEDIAIYPWFMVIWNLHPTPFFSLVIVFLCIIYNY